MIEQRVVELLAAHGDSLVGRPQALRRANPSPQEREQLAQFFMLAENLKESMPPVAPSPAFVDSLRRELVASSGVYVKRAKRTRRSVLIGAAAVGSVLSIASVVTAIVLMVSRARSRSGARAMPAP